jgi:hypothetical protein
MCRPYESAVYRPCTPHSVLLTLADSEDLLLAKTTAGLLHPATFGALKAAGMTGEESATKSVTANRAWPASWSF